MPNANKNVFKHSFVPSGVRAINTVALGLFPNPSPHFYDLAQNGNQRTREDMGHENAK